MRFAPGIGSTGGGADPAGGGSGATGYRQTSAGFSNRGASSNRDTKPARRRVP